MLLSAALYQAKNSWTQIECDWHVEGIMERETVNMLWSIDHERAAPMNNSSWLNLILQYYYRHRPSQGDLVKYKFYILMFSDSKRI